MTMLISTTGLTARIHTLPNREPFMLAADLAVAYQTKTERVAEQVKRNPRRFPDDFAFRLTEAEVTRLRLQNAGANAVSSMDRTAPLVFTRAGATQISSVLKTPVADDVSVIVHRAFAAFEKRALDEARFLLLKFSGEAMRQRPVRITIREGVRAGLDFETIHGMGSTSRPKLMQAARECLSLGLIDRLPAGMEVAQSDLFDTSNG